MDVVLEVMLYTQFTWFFFQPFLEKWKRNGTMLFGMIYYCQRKIAKCMSKWMNTDFSFFLFRPKRKQDHIHCIITALSADTVLCVCAHSMCDPFRPSLGGGVHQTEHIILALLHKRWQANRARWDEAWCLVWGAGVGRRVSQELLFVLWNISFANMHYPF